CAEVRVLSVGEGFPHRQYASADPRPRFEDCNLVTRGLESVCGYKTREPSSGDEYLHENSSFRGTCDRRYSLRVGRAVLTLFANSIPSLSRRSPPPTASHAAHLRQLSFPRAPILLGR